MTVSAHDVARELRHRFPLVGAVKLHKLLYYCQGWYTAWTGRPMFGEQIQAWENGPVVADLWRAETRNHWDTPAPTPLDDDMFIALDYVASRYGSLSGRDLIQLTHGEAPWSDAWETQGRNSEISPADIARYFQNDEELREVQAMARAMLGDDRLAAFLKQSEVPSSPAADDTPELMAMLSHAR